MKKYKILLSIMVVIVIAFVGYIVFIHNRPHHVKIIGKDLTTSFESSSRFIFIADYTVNQSLYDGTDFPTGTETTVFKKGDIVQGKYGTSGCQGAGCTPVTIVTIIVHGQNLGVDKLILVPYKQN